MVKVYVVLSFFGITSVRICVNISRIVPPSDDSQIEVNRIFILRELLEQLEHPGHLGHNVNKFWEIAEMKRFKKPFFLIGLSIACIAFVATGMFSTKASDKNRKAKVSQPGALATSLLTEDFSYTTGTALTTNGWTAHDPGGATPNPVLITSPGLTYSGYAGSGIGNAVTLATSGEDVSREFPAANSGTVYASALVNVASSQTGGGYFFHLMNAGTTTFRGRLFVRKDVATTNFAFGIARTNGTPVYTATNYVPGTTYLVVVKYTFVAGLSNDVVELFVDPTPGGAEPAATLVATDADSTEPAQLSAVAVRQGTASSAPAVQVDGIRVATTWAEVVATGGGGPTPSPTQKANVDMNGDGRTDYVITRESGSFFTNAAQPRLMQKKGDRLRRQIAESELEAISAPSALIPIEWWGLNNGAPGGTNVIWGDSGTFDNIISADFDGDDKDDVAIWRPGAPGSAAFFSINSSDLTYRIQAFGQTNDNVSIVGDYDGDGKDDSASFRCPPIGSPGQCYFFYRGSLNNPTGGITYIPWGFGDSFDFFPYSGDFDGDGKHDFCLQAVNPNAPQQAIFLLQLNDATYSKEYIYWGYSSDFLAPGDYDGDGRSDFAVVRTEDRGGIDRRVFYILHRDGTARGAQWGLADDDDIVPGDYDGDGRQDIAVYRWNSAEPRFWILPSNGNPHFTFRFGLQGDVPVATWYVQ
jgi:hypothetical protein